MTGHDIQEYEYCKEKAHSLMMDIVATGPTVEVWRISDNKLKKKYGAFRNVGEAYAFLCGYDWGTHEDYE